MNNRLLQIIAGSVIIVFGCIILIDLFVRFIDVAILLRWWPIIFIVIGILQVSSRYSHTVWIGAALLLSGTVAILDRMDLLGADFRPIIISVVLVLAGLLIITPLVTAPKRQ